MKQYGRKRHKEKENEINPYLKKYAKNNTNNKNTLWYFYCLCNPSFFIDNEHHARVFL